MVVVIDRNSEEPVYGQIATQIREQIVKGVLEPGLVLPSVRLMASDLGVNLNTVARAYRLLQEEGFLRIEDRSGAIVASPAEEPEEEVREQLSGELRTILARLRQCGLSANDLRSLTAWEIDQLEAK